jgi:hypothetical protein
MYNAIYIYIYIYIYDTAGHGSGRYGGVLAGDAAGGTN